MEKNKPKIVETIYGILVNGNLVTSCVSLAEARKKVKNIPLTEEIEQVQIVKQCVQQTLLDNYKPEVAKVLVAGELDFDW